MGKQIELVLEAAIEMDTDVTAVVRKVNRALGLKHGRLSFMIIDREFLSSVFRGLDAVISTLSGQLPTKAINSVYGRSIEVIAKVTSATGLKRVLVTPMALLFRLQTLMGNIPCVVVPNILHCAGRKEDILQNSDLDWISARARLLSDATLATCRAGKEALSKGATAVSGRELALFFNDAVENPERQGVACGVVRTSI